MNNEQLQEQIVQLNEKMDLVLEGMNRQKAQSVAVEDLIADLSIIAKDAYNSTIDELDAHNVEIDSEELAQIGIRLVKNIPNFHNALQLFESINDLARDAGPIVNEMIIDFYQKLNEFEKKGYFEFMEQVGHLIDNVVTHFSKDDVKLLADNIVTILETIKSLTQPEMLTSINNAVKIYGSMEMENIPEYSVWRLMREMNKPEMKRSIGFVVTFLNNLSKQNK
ncbi:MAG: hypothetical protein C0593_08585 [Marinilabiliales bacterium]|nr:MAG: hypothetical protein C0593_08585 [Marinilabiliales bacterium]